MKYYHIIFLFVLLAGLSFSATPISGCMNITTSDDYYLTTNLVAANQSCLPIYPAHWESCIRISTSDVTIDCNGYGIDRGPAIEEIGILAMGSSAEHLSNITVKNCPNLVGYSYGVAYWNVTNGSIHNVTAINKYSSTGYRAFVSVYGDNISIYNNTVTATGTAKGRGAIITESTNTKVVNNYFNYSSIAEVRSSSNINISDNVWRNPTSTAVSGIYLEDTNYSVILNHNITNRCELCVELNNGCNYNLINNNTFRGGLTSYAILITDPSRNSWYNNVTNNVVEDGLQIGFGITGAYSYVVNNTVRNMSQTSNGFFISDARSNFYNNSAANCSIGFDLSSATRNNFWNSTSVNNSNYGFAVIGSSSINQLFDSVTYNNGQSGVYITSPSTSTYFTNVTSYNNSEHGYHSSHATSSRFNNATAFDNNMSGFYMSGGSSRIDNSKSYNNTEYGTYLTGPQSSQYRHSTYHDNGLSGIYGSNLQTSQITNNTIYSNNGHGIFTERGYGNTIQQNQIYGNNGTGIGAEGVAPSLISGIYLFDNNIYANSLHGITMEYVRYASIQRNNVTSNTSPLFILNQSYQNTMQDNRLYSSTVGFYLLDLPYRTTRSTFRTNNIDDVDYAVSAWNASSNNFIGNIKTNVALADYLLNSSNDTIIQEELFNESNRSIVASSTLGSMLLNLTMVNFSQGGTNLSTFSMNDSMASGETYYINWSDQPSGAPYQSLHGKFVKIEALSGTPSIDTAIWYWLDSELSGYDESLFDIFKYNSTWTDMNASLDTGANTLSLLSASPLSSFGILQGGGVVNNPPDVQLNLPANGSTLTSSTVIFNFTGTDYEQTTLDCSIYLDSLLNQTNATVQNGTLTPFPISNIANGPHTWQVNCSDGNFTDASDVWTFTMNAPVNCPIITTSGNYLQPFDYTGAPNDATEVLPSAFACVKIASSDVVFDCNGYSITNDGTTDPTMGVVLNGSINNVTLQNCPSISGYSFGVYNMDSDDSTISSVTSFNSSNSDFVLNQSSNVNIMSSHAAGGGVAPSLPTTYVVASAPYGYSTISGTAVGLGDDQVSSALPIGFNFNFFGTDYNQFYISSNGFITFLSGQSNGCCSGDFLPSGGSPDGLVAGFWEDLNPSSGGTISYETIGTAPNQILVVEFNAVPHYPSTNPTYYQIKLFETSGNIEVHCQNCPSDGGSHTQGIENQDGTVGYTLTGRNSASFSLSSDAVRFTQIPAGTNPTYGIVVDQSQNAVLDDNAVNGSDVGILLTESTGSALSSNTVFDNGDGIHIFDSDTSSLASDHLYGNERDLYAESAFTYPFDFTMTEVIFDNPAAGFIDFTNLSVIETLELDSSFYMAWSALPAALPADHTSFENKHLNITRYFGSPVIDKLVWHWLDSESATYNEGNFVLYKYAGVWELVNETPDTTANTLSNFTLSDFSVFSILQDDSVQPSTPDESSESSDDPLSVSLTSTCDINTITVTSKGDDIIGAQVKVDGDVVGTTDSNGEVEFDFDCDSSIIIRASKSGYVSKTLTASTVACSECEEEPSPELEPEPEPEPQCVAPSCCVTDSQCSDIEYCSNRDTGAQSGSCIPVIGCGVISNHIVSEPYECSNQSGCACPEGFICRDHICVSRDLNGTKEAFVGFHGNFHATEGNQSCAFCDIVVTDPTGKVITGKTDANGDFTLPLTIKGTYKLALMDENGEVAAEASILSLLKPEVPDETKPTAEDTDDFSWLFLLILLVAVVLFIVYKRRKDAKKS